MRHRTRWITTLVLALLLLVGVSMSRSETSLGPCRTLAPGANISVRLPKGNYEKFFPMTSPFVQWATQQQRDCMEDARLEAVGKLAYLVKDVAPNATRGAYDCLTLAYTRILIVNTYRGKTYTTKGAAWDHNTFAGRLYQCPGSVLADYRYELMNTRNRAKAAIALKDHPDLRDVLDVNETFTGPASFTFFTPPKYDIFDREDADLVDTRVKFPPCGGGNGCVDLHAAHKAHACRSKAKCEGTDPNACDDPQVGHTLFEAGCGDDGMCEWMRRIPAFDGHTDPLWSATEKCQIALLEDIEHENWMEAEERGDAAGAQLAGIRHDLLHELENNATGWEAVYPWPGVAPDKYLAFQGNKTLSPKELLPLLVKVYGLD